MKALKTLTTVGLLAFSGMAAAQETPKEAKITLEADRIIEIAFFSIEGGKEPQLFNDYLPNIMPHMAKYGGSFLGAFNTTAIIAGDMHPQMVGIFAWDSLETRKELFKDPEAKLLFPIRDDALTMFKLGYYTVQQDTVLTLHSDKTYEFFNAWTTPEAEQSLPKYFEGTASLKKRYGSPKFVAQLQPYTYPSEVELDHIIQADMAGIVEWVNTGAYYAMNADPEFLEFKPLLDESLEKFQNIHTSFVFPQ